MSLVDEIKQAIADETEQRSESWMRLRLGKFTGSQMYRLMAQGKRPMTQEELDARPTGPRGGLLDKRETITSDEILSDGAITYIEENIGELWTGQTTHDFWSVATQWGEENEGDAREMFEQLHKCKIILKGHYIWPEQPDEAGASSDGEIEGQDAVIEIKCPLNTANHVAYMRMTSPIDLPMDYYWQCQSEMLFSGKSMCYFISYNPRVKVEKNRMKILEVPAEARAQNLIRLKLNLAIAEKKRLLELMK